MKSRFFGGPRLAGLTSILAASIALPAIAGAASIVAFHEMKIKEVYGGSLSDLESQYVVLQAYSSFQNQVQGHTVQIHDASNTVVGTFTFTQAVGSTADDMHILVATPQAQVCFGITADLPMNPVILGTGGKACFPDAVPGPECVAWGTFPTGQPGTGVPFGVPTGIPLGQGIRRDLGGNGTLENADDTDDSAADFDAVSPVPRNNAGASPAPPADNIFQDGFTSNDFSAWSTVNNPDGDLSVIPAGINGPSMQALIDDDVRLWVQDNTPNNENRYRMQFQFDPNGYTNAVDGERTKIFQVLEDTPGVRRLVTVVIRRLGGQYLLIIKTHNDDDSFTNTQFFPLTDAPHVIEIDWVRSTSPTANNGSLTLYLDGVFAERLSLLDNNLSSVDQVRMGLISIKAGASGTPQWDAMISRRCTLID